MPKPESTDSLEDIQREHILRVLKRTGWVISGPKGAGAILNVHPNTLRSLMDRLGILRATHDFVDAAQPLCGLRNGRGQGNRSQSDSPHEQRNPISG